MTLPLSGQISASDINTELNLPANSFISLGSPLVRALLGKSSGLIGFNDGHGKTYTVTQVNISADVNNYIVSPSLIPGYIPGTANLELTINAGVVIGSNSALNAALTVSNTWSVGDKVTIINNGSILGAGGNGGDGGTSTPAVPYGLGQPGQNGGTAVLALFLTKIINNGNIYGGGGGGNGTNAVYSPGDGTQYSFSYFAPGNGGGGGAGYTPGLGGLGSTGGGLGDGTNITVVEGATGYTSANGNNGSINTGGAGVNSTFNSLIAGSGGSPGNPAIVSGSGIGGGAGGYYISGNALVTWQTLGNVLGSAQ